MMSIRLTACVGGALRVRSAARALVCVQQQFSVAKLESFLAELCLHRHTANIARMALQWPSMRARILIIKLNFPLKTMHQV